MVSMVRRKLVVSLLLLAALGAFPGAAPVFGKAPVLPNAQQLATLRWYPAGRAASFTGGSHVHWAVAFDGTNLWVANLWRATP